MVNCPDTSKSDADCRKEKLSRTKWRLPVYEKPTADAKPAGIIELTIEPPVINSDAKKIPPGKIFASYLTGSEKVPIGIEYYDHESRRFYFPTKSSRGEWIELGAVPFKTPVWINPVKDWNVKLDYALVPLVTKAIYGHPQLGNIAIIGIENGKVHFKKTGPKPGCEVREDPDPTKGPGPIMKKPIQDFYDSEGRIILDLGSSRGC